VKRWLLLLILGALILWKPFVATDVARLKPVDVIRVTTHGSDVLVETDTGEMGKGKNLEIAFSDLKNTASGEIFLETADRLLISPEAVFLLPELTDYLRPGCNICVEMGAVELDAVGDFLDIHEPAVTLQDHRAGECILPVLYLIDGRMYLVE
jgi:hypothetical protein